MITLEQALTAQRFHLGTCKISNGKTGKAQPKITMTEWRRNGRTKTWKTRPGAFQVPIKWGLHDYDVLTEADADMFHVADECPALAEAQAWWEARS